MQVDRDLIIIGGGAAGLSAAQYAARANLKVMLIEQMAPGGQSLIIGDLENYPGFPEPINGGEFAQLLEEQAKNFGAEIMITTATSLKKEGEIFTVETAKGSFTSYAVIISTGAQHRKLDVPGEKEFSGRGVSYCATCDGPFFRNKKMLVVGGGDAACDEASFLANLTDKVIMIHRRDRFRAQKSLADRVLRNPNIETRFNTVIKEIKGDMKVKSVVLENLETGKQYEEDMDAVFVFIGSIPQTSLVPDLPKDEGGYILTDQNMETEVKGLYAAGDVRATPFRQLVVAAGEGAVATHCASQRIDAIKGQAYE
jgi:thioredoxin reductase (NADPH)